VNSDDEKYVAKALEKSLKYRRSDIVEEVRKRPLTVP
jgi:hypothetical protein